MDTPNHPRSATHSQDLALVAEVLDQGLREPLAALRASLDAFARRHGGRDGAALAQAALDRVVELSRTVHDLTDFASPPPIRPMSCSVEEIVRGALEELAPGARRRVLLALEDRKKRLFVDGPLLSRCLGHLVADGLQGDAECMLHVRRFGGRTQFVILHTPPIELLPSSASLAHAIARRDLERMGGSLTSRASAGTSTSVVEGLAESERQEAAA